MYYIVSPDQWGARHLRIAAAYILFFMYFPVREFIYRDTGFRPAQHRRNPEQKNSELTQAYELCRVLHNFFSALARSGKQIFKWLQNTCPKTNFTCPKN